MCSHTRTEFIARIMIMILGVIACTVGASAQTITVTTGLLDDVDVPANATIADLPGPDGYVCLREAFLVSDNTPGVQTIAFNVPTDQWYLRNIFPEFCCLYARFGMGASDTVIVDGTTQTQFTGDTNPGGNEVVLYGAQMSFGGPSSEVFGIHSTDIVVDGNDTHVHDNTEAYIRSYFNSGTQIYDNQGDTVQLYGADDCHLFGNTIERVRITGGSPTDPASGNVIGGPDPADRNFITGWGNVGEHGSPSGTTIELYGTTDTLIQNNYIGTTPDGMSIGNHSSTAGVAVYSDNHDLTVRDNLIAIWAGWGGGSDPPRKGTGIFIEGSEGATNIAIVNNTIGLNAAGEPLLGGNSGIYVYRHGLAEGRDIRIDSNTIAGHESTGILCENGPGIDPARGVRITANSIYANGEIGIDLTPNTWDFGPTPNDPFDADIGANGLQNHPEITMARLWGGSLLEVTGTLHSERHRNYSIELFASPACDPSGFGQGEVYLGAGSVRTDSAGNAALRTVLPVTIPAGWVVTGTATNLLTDETSEFSSCQPIGKGQFGRKGQGLMWNPLKDRRP